MLHRLTAGLFLALVACAAFGLAGPLIAPTGALAPVSAAAAPLDYSAQAAVTVADSPPGRLPAADQPPADPPPTPPAAEGQPAGKQPATDAAPAGAPADTQEVALEDADALLEQLAVDESLPVEAADATISVKPGRFKVDLYREGIHVRQVNNQTCVATSIQMMANIMDSRKPDRTKQRQLDLYQFARGASRTASVAGQVGITASGWANALNELGYGKYKSMTLPSREKALRTAARQMRLTGKPVGMFVWDGIHAWKPLITQAWMPSQTNMPTGLPVSRI